MAGESFSREIIEQETFKLRHQLRDLQRRRDLELESYPLPDPEKVKSWGQSDLLANIPAGRSITEMRRQIEADFQALIEPIQGQLNQYQHACAHIYTVRAYQAGLAPGFKNGCIICGLGADD